MINNHNLYARLSAGFDGSRTCLELLDGRSVSYAEVEQHAARAAGALLASGLKAGDRVSVLAEKSAAYLWLYLGALRAGLVFHPLNPAYTERELSFFLDNAGTRLLVHDEGYTAKARAALDGTSTPADALTLNADGSGSLSDRAAAQSGEFTTHVNAADDTAALLYSSGTTGTPKGIRITHGNLYANALALRQAWAFSAEDILVHALPVFHVHGLFITLGPALLAGTRLRFLPRFEPQAVMNALDGATMMAGVPTYYGRLLGEPGFTRDTCRSIRVFISGSAPLSESAFHAFEARTGHRILERYGMTETGINTSNPLDGERKPASVGPPLPGVDLRITSGDGGACEASSIGDIEVRGDNVFPGYWELPEATARAFDDDGWFDTGDQGYLDADGYLFIVGRSKDMVISGGLNVYPKEIERELETLDAIAEAAVFGVEHADFGEAVIAAAVPRPGQVMDEAAIIATLKTRLANFKVPKRVLSLDDLPRNTMGKVQKNVLRERYAGLFRD